MSNRKNIKVEPAFLTEIQERFRADDKKVDPALRKSNWAIQFAHLLNGFIHQELAHFDPNLHQKVYGKNGGEYPSPKTISRAFVNEKAASLDLLHICGWYLFGKNWRTEQQRFNLSDEANPQSQGRFASQATNIEAGEIVEVKIKNTTAKIDQVKAGRNIIIDISNDSVPDLD